MTKGADNKPADNDKPPKGRRRKRRRGLRVLIVLLSLASAIWASPYLASTGIGTRLVLSIANSRLQGEVRIAELSLSWLGPCEIGGLRALDPSGRTVLDVTRIRLDRGVWHLLTAAEDFGDVGIDSPRVFLYIGPDGGVSISRAFSSPDEARPDAEPEEPEEEALPSPRGKVTWHSGEVTIIRADGRALRLRDVGGQLELYTLNDIVASFTAALDGDPSGPPRDSRSGGVLTGDIEFKGLVWRGKICPQRLNGSASLRSDEDMDITEAVLFATGIAGVEGKAGVDARFALGPGNMQGDLAVRLTGLSAGRPGEATRLEPIDLAIIASAVRGKGAISGQLDVSGTPASLSAKFSCRSGGRTHALSLGDLLSAILTGKSLGLPEFRFDVRGDADLPALARAVPAILKIKPGVEITGGKLLLKDISVSGGAVPAASGTIELVGLSAREGEREIKVSPASAVFEMSLEPAKGLQIRRADFSSGFAKIQARGTPDALHADFTADLAKLQKQLQQIVQTGDMELRGTVAGTAGIGRKDKHRADFDLSVTADGLQWDAGGREFAVNHAGLKCRGFLALADGRVTRIEVEEMRAEIDEDVAVALTGQYDLENGRCRAQVHIERAKLGRVAAWARQAGAGDFSRYAGTLTLKASVERASSDAPVVTSGEAAVDGLKVDGHVLTEGPVSLRWSKVRVSAERLDLASAVLRSPFATVTVEDLRCRLGPQFSAEGKASARVDLAPCLEAAGRIAKWENPPPVAGRLTWAGALTSSGGRTALKGEGTVKKFRVGTGPRAVREEAVNFVHDIEVDPKKDLLVLRQTKITSKLITAQVAGTIANYSTRRELDLRGSYKTSLEDVTALMHQLAPETAETVSLAGVTQSEFKITGPAYQPEFRPVFRKLDGGADVGWASAQVFGLALGKAKLSPTLSDGQLKLPLAVIPASGGKLRVRGVVDFRTAAPTLRMPGKTVVLENVELTPEVGRLLLSRFNPIFARVTHLGGRASLTLRDIVIPLDSQTKDKISGRGQLDLTRITVGPPSGILKELLTLLRLVEGDKYPMKFSSTDFVIKDGRIEYDNFTLSLGEGVDLRFYGSVGFDDTLDMVVSVPVGVILLEKLNVKGPLADYARLLEGSNVDIRIVGTRLKHKLKLSDVDILPLIKRAARALLSEELLKRIKEALGDTKPEEKKPDEGDAEPREPGRPPPDQVPEAEPPEKKPEEELLDNLLDFLMDKIEDSKQDKEKRKEEEKEPD